MDIRDEKPPECLRAASLHVTSGASDEQRRHFPSFVPVCPNVPRGLPSFSGFKTIGSQGGVVFSDLRVTVSLLIVRWKPFSRWLPGV